MLFIININYANRIRKAFDENYHTLSRYFIQTVKEKLILNGFLRPRNLFQNILLNLSPLSLRQLCLQEYHPVSYFHPQRP